MKKHFLFFLFGLITLTSVGQIEIHKGTSGDVSGTQIDFTSSGAEVIVDLEVINYAASPKYLKIKRTRLAEVTGWEDFFCWGAANDPINGACYPYVAQDPWLSPDSILLNNGEIGDLAVHVKPFGDFGCGLYRYEVMDGPTAVSSIDISVCKSVSVNELAPLTFSIVPNPANDHFSVSIDAAENASLKLIDLLGNVVLNQTEIGSSIFINTENLPNGVYLVFVEADGIQPAIRKIAIRH
jgi:hypothetical protein